MKSSTIKNYFNAAAEGNVELLRTALNKHPKLIDAKNKNTEHTSIYYTVRNLKKDATLYLLKYSPRISHRELNYLISNEWYGSLSSYYFLLEVGRDLYSEAPGISHIDLKTWITNKYIHCYFQHRNIDRLIKFYESIQKETDWQKVLDQYNSYSGNIPNGNSNHIKFIRELKLRTLV